MNKALKRTLYFVTAFALVVMSAFGAGAPDAAKAHAAGTAAVTAVAPDTVVNGAQFSMTFLMNNTSGKSIFALDFEVLYPKDAFEFISGIIDKSLFAASQPVTSRTEGVVKLAPEATGSVTAQTYTFATLVFKSKATAAAGSYEFQIKDLAVATIDSGDIEVPSSSVNKTVSIEAPSSAAELTSVTVKSDGTAVAGALSGTTYTVTDPVPYGAAITVAANVSAKASVKIADSAAVPSQDKQITLAVGANTLPIEVTAENGTTKKNYSLKVVRAEGDASTQITALSVKDASGAALAVTASGDIYTVSNMIPYNQRESVKLNVSVAPTTGIKIAGVAAVSGQDSVLTLVEGENRVSVAVTSETDVSKTYTVVMNVEAAKTDCGLASLAVVSGETSFELSPAFSAEVFTYVLRIPEATESLTVNATASDASAEIVSGARAYTKDEIKAGEILTVVVRAQNGGTKNYSLVVAHMSGDKEGLATLKVNGVDIDLKPDTYTYEVNVGKDADTLDLDYTALFDAEVEVLGSTKLVEGNNTVILKVQLKDGGYRFYTVNVLKESPQNETAVDNTVLYILIGVSAVLLTAFIVALIAAVKAKKRGDKRPPDGGIHVNVTMPNTSEKENTAAKEEPKEAKMPEETQRELAKAEQPQKSENDAALVQSKSETLTEAYNSLTREQKSFFDNLKKYALAKPGASTVMTKTHETVKMGKTPILKLQIRRGVTIASFMLENEQLKQYRIQTARSEGAQIKVKASEIAVCNLESYNTAVGMIDLMLQQSKK